MPSSPAPQAKDKQLWAARFTGTFLHHRSARYSAHGTPQRQSIPASPFPGAFDTAQAQPMLPEPASPSWGSPGPGSEAGGPAPGSDGGNRPLLPSFAKRLAARAQAMQVHATKAGGLTTLQVSGWCVATATYRLCA